VWEAQTKPRCAPGIRRLWVFWQLLREGLDAAKVGAFAAAAVFRVELLVGGGLPVVYQWQFACNFFGFLGRLTQSVAKTTA
jgi:hypothetical protein